MASKPGSKSKKTGSRQPTIENRKARHDFHIAETLECGIKLTGTEVKSLRNGQASLGEGYVRAEDSPIRLTMHGVHIAVYPPAGEHRQHMPTRTRILLAQKREIKKLADKTRTKGTTLIPLKIYFTRGMAKVLIGLAMRRRKADKRQVLDAKEAKREISRAMSRKR